MASLVVAHISQLAAAERQAVQEYLNRDLWLITSTSSNGDTDQKTVTAATVDDLVSSLFTDPWFVGWLFLSYECSKASYTESIILQKRIQALGLIISTDRTANARDAVKRDFDLYRKQYLYPDFSFWEEMQAFSDDFMEEVGDWPVLGQRITAKFRNDSRFLPTIKQFAAICCGSGLLRLSATNISSCNCTDLHQIMSREVW